MRRLVAAALLAAGTIATVPARALDIADVPHCGANLVAGMAGCITWEMKISEHKALVARALRGDNKAANRLGSFYESMHSPRHREARKWWLLSARRGNCNAMVWAYANEKRARRGKWGEAFRRKRCPAQAFVNYDD